MRLKDEMCLTSVTIAVGGGAWLCVRGTVGYTQESHSVAPMAYMLFCSCHQELLGVTDALLMGELLFGAAPWAKGRSRPSAMEALANK